MAVIRYVLCLLGILFAMPLLVLIIFAFKLPVTTSGVYYLIAGSLIVSGLIVAPLAPRHFFKIVIAGLIGLFLIVDMRLVIIKQNQFSEIQMIILPEGKESRWIGSIVDEQDALIFGEMLFHQIGADSNREHANLGSAFVTMYSRIRKDGNFPSPILSTYLNLQTPTHFDVVIALPETKPHFGVIFLHGYMGNVTAQCLVIAQAVREQNGMTICPSTKWTGEWWLPEGQLILHSSFNYLRERGIQTIYVGGFSNGGFGISRLTSELGREDGLTGLFFIDGFANGTGVRDLGMPVLIIEGTQDERVPPPVAREFAAEVGNLGTYVEINSDHFLIMKQPDLVQDSISTWLESREAK